jgi:hypothetical protein
MPFSIWVFPKGNMNVSALKKSDIARGTEPWGGQCSRLFQEAKLGVKLKGRFSDQVQYNKIQPFVEHSRVLSE